MVRLDDFALKITKWSIEPEKKWGLVKPKAATSHLPVKLKKTREVCERQVKRLSRLLAEPASLPKQKQVQALIERAALLAYLGRHLDARADHLSVLELDDTNLKNLLDLGRLLIVTGQRKAAKVVYEQAVKHHPDDIASHVNLASAMLELDDPIGAREHYEIALKIDPEMIEAHGGMYYALNQTGEFEAARAHQKIAFGRKHLFQSPYRGDDPPIPIILLVSSTGGITPIEQLLDDTVFQTYVVVADFYDPNTPLPSHQLVFNGIGDVEVATDALLACEALLKQTSAIVLNLPAAVLATSRSENAMRMANLSGVSTARTALYPYELLAGQDGAAALERDGFTFPVLLRAPGFHMGQHFVQVDAPAKLASQVATLPGAGRNGAELLAIAYLDARGADGCFRKFRAMFVGGEILPLHLAISQNWKIHYFSADMATRADHRAEEQRFLAAMPTFIGPRAMAGLEAIQSTLGLDYGGIDFGLSPTGDVLLFEANATMIVQQPDPDPLWDYRRAAVDRIHAAVRKLLMRSCTVSSEPKVPITG